MRRGSSEAEMLSSGRLVPGDSLASLFSVMQAPYLKPRTASQPRSRPKGMCLWAGFGGPSFADAHGTTPGRPAAPLHSRFVLGEDLLGSQEAGGKDDGPHGHLIKWQDRGGLPKTGGEVGLSPRSYGLLLRGTVPTYVASGDM